MDLLQLLVDAEAEESSSSSNKMAAADSATDNGEDTDTDKTSADNHQSSGRKMRLSAEVRYVT